MNRSRTSIAEETRPGARRVTRALLAIVAWASLASLVAGCFDAYTMPDAPPREAWVDLSAVEAEDEETKRKRFLDAKRVAILTYTALTKGEWDKALELMSQETRNFLEDASAGKGAAAALRDGELAIGDQSRAFDPLTDFFIADLKGIDDTHSGAPPESETKRRKELYAIDGAGRARKLVLIYEEDAWRFHSPFIGSTLIEPAD